MKIKTKVAIVTGASEGIGFAISCYLASKNYKLLMLSRNKKKLQNSLLKINRIFPRIQYQPEIIALDVFDHKEVHKAVKNFIKKNGHVNLLCNNAGYVKRGSSELSLNEFTKMINTNLIGTFNFVKAVVPVMKKLKSGRIINIASISGKVARKHLGGYAASKFGVIGLNEALFKELAPYGIQVTAICPNLVNTKMTADVKMDKSKMINTEEIVKTVDFLLSLSDSVCIKEIILQCKDTLINET